MRETQDRVATRSSASSWLLEWADHGWLPARSPQIVGRTLTGEEVLRLVLVRTRRDAAHPAVPDVPDWWPSGGARRHPHPRQAHGLVRET